MSKPIFDLTVQVQSGKIVGTGCNVLASFINNLLDGRYIIKITKIGKKRSLLQNSYYW